MDQPQSKTNKAKPEKPKPRASRRSLAAHLADLHSLLRSPSFSSWPLRVRFFCADVYRVWRVWNDRVDATIPADKIILDGDCPRRGDQDAAAVGDINKLAVDYAPLEEYLEKSMFALEDAGDLCCAVCRARVVPDADHVVMCPQGSCRAASHLSCLSAIFTDDSSSLVPTQGTCPSCKNSVHWPTMMRELTLRNRGDKDARAVLRKKERRERKMATKTASTKQASREEAPKEQTNRGFVFPSGFTFPT